MELSCSCLKTCSALKDVSCYLKVLYSTVYMHQPNFIIIHLNEDTFTENCNLACIPAKSSFLTNLSTPSCLACLIVIRFAYSTGLTKQNISEKYWRTKFDFGEFEQTPCILDYLLLWLILQCLRTYSMLDIIILFYFICPKINVSFE